MGWADARRSYVQRSGWGVHRVRAGCHIRHRRTRRKLSWPARSSHPPARNARGERAPRCNAGRVPVSERAGEAKRLPMIVHIMQNAVESRQCLSYQYHEIYYFVLRTHCSGAGRYPGRLRAEQSHRNTAYGKPATSRSYGDGCAAYGYTYPGPLHRHRLLSLLWWHMNPRPHQPRSQYRRRGRRLAQGPGGDLRSPLNIAARHTILTTIPTPNP